MSSGALGGQIKNALLTASVQYSRATTFTSYVERPDAAKEVYELLRRLKPDEHRFISREEKRACKKLVSLIKKKCREQFQELPEWLK